MSFAFECQEKGKARGRRRERCLALPTLLTNVLNFCSALLGAMGSGDHNLGCAEPPPRVQSLQKLSAEWT